MESNSTSRSTNSRSTCHGVIYICNYETNNKFSYNYDLYGICNHSGGVFGGHYTAYIKNANNKWYHFNDQIVQEMEDLSKLCSPNAYCLFYRKKK